MTKRYSVRRVSNRWSVSDPDGHPIYFDKFTSGLQIRTWIGKQIRSTVSQYAIGLNPSRRDVFDLDEVPLKDLQHALEAIQRDFGDFRTDDVMPWHHHDCDLYTWNTQTKLWD